MIAPPQLLPLGEHAWRFALPPSADRRALLGALRAVAGVVDVVLAEDLGAVVLDAEATPDVVARTLEHVLVDAPAARTGAPAPRITIPVVYDGEDLLPLAEALGLSTEALVALHARRDYEVAMVGFLPGFAYLRGLDPRLVVPRRASPRTRVPARSVAIAAGYTGIYPSPSPGGWHLLGEAPAFVPFDARGAALALGDRVRFEPVARTAAPAAGPPAAAVPRAAGRRWLEVSAVRGPAIVVDGGRPGHMHEGVPHGGPLIRGAMARANAAAGNARGACAVELYGAIDVVARGGRITVADDGGARTLEDGECLTARPPAGRRAGYLAVQGGLDVPLVLGSRCTLLSAQLGGLAGRTLRRGASLVVAEETEEPHALGGDAPPAPAPSSVIALLAGPDADPVALRALLRTPFAIAAASDRTGTRLDGPPLPASVHSARDRRSGPMVRGAVELTPAGPIVLGPDHPTTGGYPVVAVVREEATDAFFGAPIGAPIRFAAGE
ncbi:MAG TPA: carboxyltransferase domain-containing protein [Labilithrix sp.]|nr:carboxyltransferase domain-containing protein [Labilithrix sp.]